MGNTMLILIMVFVAGYLAKAVFTGKGKLLEAENIKKGKEQEYKKYLRLLYTGMFVMTILIALVNAAGTYGYTVEYEYTFTQDYTDADGIVHPAGVPHTLEEMQQINYVQSESTGSLCAVGSQETIPYEAKQLPPQLNWPWMHFLPYQALVVLNYVCMGISVLLVIGIFVFINRYTDKEAKAKAQAAAAGQRPSMPKGAFDFEDAGETFPVNEKDDPDAGEKK